MDSYIERLHNAITSATQNMTIQELEQHPKGKWSTAEILEHLYLTYRGTSKGFERCWEAGKPLATALTLKQRVAIALVIDAGYFPDGRKSPERAYPKGMPADKVQAEVGRQLAQMDEWITKCEARHGKRTRLVDHPIFGPLTARQWRKFHWLHGRHHVRQIVRLRRQQTAN